MIEKEVKEVTLKKKIINYFKGLIIVLTLNVILAAIITLIGTRYFHVAMSKESFSNGMFMASLPIMLYCYGLFNGDVSDRMVDSSNYEYTPRNFDKRNNSQRLMDAFNRSEQMFIGGSYLIASLVAAYIVAVI